MKKIILFLVLMLSFGNTFAASGSTLIKNAQDNYYNSKTELNKINNNIKNYNSNTKKIEELKNDFESTNDYISRKLVNDKIDKLTSDNSKYNISELNDNASVLTNKISINEEKMYEAYAKEGNSLQKLKAAEFELDEQKKHLNSCSADEDCEDIEKAVENAEKGLKDAKDNHAVSDLGKADLTSYGFEINVGDLTPGGTSKELSGKTIDEKANWILGTIIQSMMMAIGILSIFIMTIGGGYIILHNGQDELLSKGKAIFMSGIYAMVVALSSYILVAIIRYILYANN